MSQSEIRGGLPKAEARGGLQLYNIRDALQLSRVCRQLSVETNSKLWKDATILYDFQHSAHITHPRSVLSPKALEAITKIYFKSPKAIEISPVYLKKQMPQLKEVTVPKATAADENGLVPCFSEEEAQHQQRYAEYGLVKANFICYKDYSKFVWNKRSLKKLIPELRREDRRLQD